VNCPRQYHGKYVLKKFPREEQSPEQVYGEEAHKHFENRQAHGTELPEDLAVHEPFMKRLDALPGMTFVENKVALTKKLEAVSWDWRRDEIWFRGIIDFKKVDDESKRAWIVDYKTGRPHQKLRQLVIYAIHTFIAHPNVDLIDARFYWTKDGTNTRKVWDRTELEGLWGTIIGDLRQYKEAFKTNIWQPRPSGLCAGWCPDTDCEYWKSKRK
jgi:hypothetical protein